MKKPVKFAVIGCGHMGAFAEDRAQDWETRRLYVPFSHAAAIRAVPDTQLVAVCDVRADATRRAVERYPDVRAYQDAEEMLARERPDVVTIATRTQERTALIERCLAAGCRALYVEKPLSNTLEQADAIAAAVHKNGVSFIYGTQRRFAESYRIARQAVVERAFGQLKSIQLQLGAGPLFWTQPHAVDMALYLTGDGLIDHVQSELALDPTTVVDKIVEDDPLVRYAHLCFKSGTRAFILPSATCDVQLTFEGGQMTVRDNGLGIETRQRHDKSIYNDGLFSKSSFSEVTQPTSPTTVAMATLAAAVRDGEHLVGGVDQAVANQEILFGIVLSHLRKSARVEWPLHREGWVMNARTGTLFA